MKQQQLLGEIYIGLLDITSSPAATSIKNNKKPKQINLPYS